MIKMAIDGPLEHHQCDLQINGRYVAALIFSLDGNVLVMWDWKSGECVHVSSLPYILFIAHLPHTIRYQHELGVFSYTFLNACTPLLVVEKGDQIAFTARSPSRLGGANSNPESETKAKYLMFPDLNTPDMVYDNSAAFLDGKLSQPESYPSTSFSRATVPAHRDHGVVALSFSTIEVDPESIDRDKYACHLVFFLRETLAHLFQQEQEQEYFLEAKGKGEASYIVDWNDWGPQASRWFDAPWSYSNFGRWRCSVHGYRFVTLVNLHDVSKLGISLSPHHAIWRKRKYGHIPHTEDALYLLVLDFNPRPLRGYQCLPETENSCPSSDGISYVHSSVITPSDNTFPNYDAHFPVDFFIHHTKHLACRVTLMPEPVDYDALAVCEDNIIAIQVRPKKNAGVAELS